LTGPFYMTHKTVLSSFPKSVLFVVVAVFLYPKKKYGHQRTGGGKGIIKKRIQPTMNIHF